MIQNLRGHSESIDFLYFENSLLLLCSHDKSLYRVIVKVFLEKIPISTCSLDFFFPYLQLANIV